MKKNVLAAITLGSFMLTAFTDASVQPQRRIAFVTEKAPQLRNNMNSDHVPTALQSGNKANLSQADGK